MTGAVRFVVSVVGAVNGRVLALLVAVMVLGGVWLMAGWAGQMGAEPHQMVAPP